MTTQKLIDAIERIKGITCNQDDVVCMAGNDADRATMQEAITALEEVRADLTQPAVDVGEALEKLDQMRLRAYSHANISNSPKDMKEWIDRDYDAIKRALSQHPDAELLEALEMWVRDGDHLIPRTRENMFTKAEENLLETFTEFKVHAEQKGQ